MNIQLSQKRISYLQEALCISVAVCTGLAIYLGFRVTLGFWIPMTTCIMFLAANLGQGVILKRTVDRVVGILVGAFLGFLYVNIFMYGNYHWAYLLPFVWFLGFYFFYITNNYVILSAMIIMFVPMLMSMMSTAPISIGDTLVKCLFFTVLGVLIALIAEFVIYKDATSVKPAMKLNTDDFFHSQGDIIRLASNFFINDQLKTRLAIDEFRKTFWKFISSVSSIENLYLNICYEFDYKEDQEWFYECLFRHIAGIDLLTRKLVGVMGHDKYDGSILSADKLTEISNNLSEKYKNILLYFDGKTDDISEKIFLLLENIKPGDKINPTYLFIKALYELSLVADEFSYAVYNEKFEIVRDIL